MKRRSRSFLIMLGMLLLLSVVAVVSIPQPKTEQVNLSQIIEQTQNGQIAKIEVDGDKLTATRKDNPNGPKLVANKEPEATLADYGIDYRKVQIESKNDSSTGQYIIAGIFSILPF